MNNKNYTVTFKELMGALDVAEKKAATQEVHEEVVEMVKSMLHPANAVLTLGASDVIGCFLDGDIQVIDISVDAAKEDRMKTLLEQATEFARGHEPCKHALAFVYDSEREPMSMEDFQEFSKWLETSSEEIKWGMAKQACPEIRSTVMMQ